MTAESFTPLLELAKQAKEGNEEATKELHLWFDKDPEAVIRAVQAAARIISHPGGINHQVLYQAITRITP